MHSLLEERVKSLLRERIDIFNKTSKGTSSSSSNPLNDNDLEASLTKDLTKKAVTLITPLVPSVGKDIFSDPSYHNHITSHIISLSLCLFYLRIIYIHLSLYIYI